MVIDNIELFTKSEFKDYMMKFEVFKPNEETAYSMEIDFVVYTDINNEKIFCYASFSIHANKYTYDEYNELVDELLNFKDKEIKVRVIFKKNKAKKFKIDISSIAIAYGDNRLNDLELLGWGLHNVWPIK